MSRFLLPVMLMSAMLSAFILLKTAVPIIPSGTFPIRPGLSIEAEVVFDTLSRITPVFAGESGSREQSWLLGGKVWKVTEGDVESDGKPELLVGVEKKTRFHFEEAKRIFVFSFEDGFIRPKWLGSRFVNPVIDYEWSENRLLVLEAGPEGRLRCSYSWTGFGFVLQACSAESQ